MICGAPQPPGHVTVNTARGRRVGRVCSKHTLWEIISHSSDRFMVEITVTTDGVNALERAQARIPEGSLNIMDRVVIEPPKRSHGK